MMTIESAAISDWLTPIMIWLAAEGVGRLLSPQDVAGWMVVIVLEPLARSVGSDGLMLLILGGLAYSVGVIFYAWERLPYNHAVWHVFVLAGSACHFSCVLGYVVPPAG